ncbi:MAG: carboxypeptidase regulatory-like domain-containing protein [Candidatus Neomarinimicrobiota bacterium]
MKKLGLWLLVPIFMFSTLLGENTDRGAGWAIDNPKLAAPAAKVADQQAAAIKQPRNLIAWKSVFRGDRLAARGRAAETEVLTPQQAARNRQMRQRPQHREPTTATWFPGGQWIKSEREATLRKTLGVGDIPVQILDVTGEPITSYEVGDTIAIVITYADSVWIELYVDDGDGEFDPGLDFYYFPGDPEGGMEEIVIMDGDWEDEDPAPGVWKITFDTGDIEEGAELFGLQGVRLFLYGYSRDMVDTGLATLDVLPPASTTGIAGNVSLAADGPAPNIVIGAFPMATMKMEDSPEDMFLTMTDAEGNYTLAIDDEVTGQLFALFAVDVWGLYPGLFADPQFREEWVPTGGALTGVNFALIPGTAAISGTLKDNNNAPIPDIRIFASNGPSSIVDTTDASGYYEIIVMPGWWWLTPSAHDLMDASYMAFEGVDVEVMEDMPNPMVDMVTYVTDASIQGTVSWAAGGPAAGAEIFAGTWRYQSWTETDELGNYVLPVSSALDEIEFSDEWGSWMNYGYWVSVWAGENVLSDPGGYGEVYSGSTGIDFTLYEANASLSGFIFYEGGGPAPDAQVQAYVVDDTLELRSWAESGGDGYFEMPLLGNHTWVVEVYRPYEGWPPAIIDSSLGMVYPGQDLYREYYLPAAAERAAVHGHVYNTEGYPIVGAKLELIQTDGPFYGEAFTDAGGYFRIEDVPTFHEYNVIASAKGYPRQYQHIWVGGEDIYVGFWLGEFRVRVSGQVTAEDETPIFEAAVLAYAPDVTEPVNGAMTYEDGYYELFLKSGLHTLKAGATGFLVSAVGLDVQGDTTIDFTLVAVTDQLTASIEGRVTDEGGYGLSRVWIAFVSDAYITFAKTGYDGNYHLDLIPGHYLAVYQKEGFEEKMLEWDVVAGAHTGLDVVLFPEAYLQLLSANDVPGDHGKQVWLEWEINPMIAGEVEWIGIYCLGEGEYPPDPYNWQTPWIPIDDFPPHTGTTHYKYPARTIHDGVPTWYIVTAFTFGYEGRLQLLADSNPISGVSEDNLPPAPPAMLATAVVGSSVELTWAPCVDDPVAVTPVKYYSVYRSDNGGAYNLVGHTGEPGFVDELKAGSYQWYVTATDFAENHSEPSEPTTVVTLGLEAGLGIPEEYALRANYPNPFNPNTTIVYELPEASAVTLKVYDLTGKLIRTLVSEAMPAGYHTVVWDGKDAKGTSVATGVYFYRIAAGEDFTETRKMVLIK